MRQCIVCDKELIGKQRKFCSLKCQKKYQYHSEWYKNYTKQRRERFDKFKVEEGCEYCGYNKCPGSLVFHHINDTDKYVIHANTFDTPKGKKELKKCICLCSNCHNELHYKENKNQFGKWKRGNKNGIK